MPRLSIEDVAVGDVLTYLYDTGAMGYTTCFVLVRRLGKRKILLRFETGAERWKYPNYCEKKLSATYAAELRTESGFEFLHVTH